MNGAVACDSAWDVTRRGYLEGFRFSPNNPCFISRYGRVAALLETNGYVIELPYDVSVRRRL